MAEGSVRLFYLVNLKRGPRILHADQKMSEIKKLTWSEYPWPSWVPQSTRDSIARFWGDPNKREPAEYDRFWKSGSDNHPPMGTLVRCQSDARYWRRSTESNEDVIGLWVPTWNNMSVVVTASGEASVRSTCGILDYIEGPVPLAVCKCDGAVRYTGSKGILCRNPEVVAACRFCGRPWEIFLPISTQCQRNQPEAAPERAQADQRQDERA